MRTGREHFLIFRIKWWMLLFVMNAAVNVFAQDKQSGQVEGIVFDKDTKEREARVLVLNLNTGKSWYNNLKGEFTVDAKTGDKLVFTKEDFVPDTVEIKSSSNLAIYMQRTAIMLREVTIRDSM